MKKRSRRTKERTELSEALRETKLRIDTVNQLFDVIDDTVLMDACIYELKFLRLRYAYLMRLAREESVKALTSTEAQTVVLTPLETT